MAGQKSAATTDRCQALGAAMGLPRLEIDQPPFARSDQADLGLDFDTVRPGGQ
jgi:hypothetical protein